MEDAVREALRNPSSAAAGQLPSASGLMPSNMSSRNPTSGSQTASPSHIAQLSRLVVDGDKRGAAEYAADQGLWSHALIISSSVGPEFWKEIVSRFSTAELGLSHDAAALKASYTIFAGITSETGKSWHMLLKTTADIPVDDLIVAANITNDPSADRWREMLAAVVFNSTAAQLACLDELGNRLMGLKLVNAAQAWWVTASHG